MKIIDSLYLFILLINSAHYAVSLKERSQGIDYTQPITIQSADSNTFLRASACSCKGNGPCGKVNLQTIPGPWETWNFKQNSDGTICIASKQFPNTFLSLDTSDCKVFSSEGCGVSYLNYGVCSTNQQFKLIPSGDGHYFLQTISNPNVYLRLDGTAMTEFNPNGAGFVNGQFIETGKLPSPKETLKISNTSENNSNNNDEELAKRIKDLEDQAKNLKENINELINQDSYINRRCGQNYPSITVDGVNIMNYMYREAIIYESIFDALKTNVVMKNGQPTSWDSTTYATSKWNDRNILNIGVGVQANGNGLVVNVPRCSSGGVYNVLWLRVLNDRYTTFRVSSFQSSVNDPNDTDTNDVAEVYSCGLRSIIEISPDGGAPSSQQRLHMWCPIPIRNTGKLIVYSDVYSDDWISGIAFGKNLWNHAKMSAKGFALKLNGGTDIPMDSDNWNNDVLARIPERKISILIVPVVPSGRDKIIYIAEHNSNWLGVMHGNVWVNDRPVERFRTSYSNPFATHMNSKFYSRYIATRIPADYIQPTAKFVTLKIDMTNQDISLYFREIGTHDYICN